MSWNQLVRVVTAVSTATRGPPVWAAGAALRFVPQPQSAAQELKNKPAAAIVRQAKNFMRLKVAGRGGHCKDSGLSGADGFSALKWHISVLFRPRNRHWQFAACGLVSGDFALFADA